ncbi:hypothetical protein BC834DRAFT_831589, partial [Gloeopeniophorella convolvens]
PAARGKTVLVPLTDSLYIIVDVGTGYYTRAQVVKHWQKIDSFKSNIGTLQETIQERQENSKYLISVIQSKPHAQLTGNSNV